MINNWDFPLVFDIQLSFNEISSLEKMTKVPNLSGLVVENNYLTFEYILPNLSTPQSRYFYANQQQIYKDTTIYKATSETLTIDLLIDDTVTSNIYKWYKNGQLLTTINGNNELVNNNLEYNDRGIYTCQVTNPNAPDLTLYSHNIELNMLSDCYFHFIDNYNPIPSHTYKAQTTINSSGTVESGSTVHFIAASSVTLEPGFHAKSGSDFLAAIGLGCVDDTFTNEDTEVASRSKQKSIIENTNLTVYPNPFHNQTYIQYHLAKNQTINLGVYSSTGQLIKVFEQNTLQTTGQYQYEFKGNQLEGGMYFVILQTEKEVLSQKIVLIK